MESPLGTAAEIFLPVRKSRPASGQICFTCDRVSSKKQEDNTSLRAQKERGLNYARENNYYVVHNYYFVESASKRERPNFHAMIRDAIRQGVNILIFKTVSMIFLGRGSAFKSNCA